MEFEWDENKNLINKLKHGIRFEDAIEIFQYQMIENIDNRQDYGEIRYIGIGRNSQNYILTVVYTIRGSKIRIISARTAKKRERKIYGISN